MSYAGKPLSTGRSARCTRISTQTPINQSCSLLISSLSSSISLLLMWTCLDEHVKNFKIRLKWIYFYINSYHHKWNYYTCMMYLEGRCLFLYTESHFTGLGYASEFSQNIQFQISCLMTMSFSLSNTILPL